MACAAAAIDANAEHKAIRVFLLKCIGMAALVLNAIMAGGMKVRP